MEKLLAEHPQIDAVLSANDSMALGVLEALKSRQPDGDRDRRQRHSPRRKNRSRPARSLPPSINMFKIGCTANAGGGPLSQARAVAGQGDAASRGPSTGQTTKRGWFRSSSAPARNGMTLCAEHLLG